MSMWSRTGYGVRALVALVLVSVMAWSAGADDAAELVLIEVNGEPITGADLDAMIMETHERGAMTRDMSTDLVPKLLTKAIRDRLILQDAAAIGMYEDPDLVIPVQDKATRMAISIYSQSMVEQPTISPTEILDHFNHYYHKIKLRQLTLSTPEECIDAIQKIQAGEVKMGELAVNTSLDALKARGGLHGDNYWTDVEVPLRDASVGLEPGEYSKPFPYYDKWSFVRVESRTPVDIDDLEKFESYIEMILRTARYEELWDEFVAGEMSRVDVTVNEEVLEAIREDEDVLFRGEFKDGTDRPVLTIDDEHYATEKRFRSEMSKIAMEFGDESFESILDRSIRSEKEILVLAWAAEQAGVFEQPDVVAYYEKQLDRAVLNRYLADHIAQHITFKRDEYEQFYLDHQDDFRGTEEVRLSILTSGDRAVVEAAAARLKDGADFEFVRAEVEGREPGAAVQEPSWSPINVFSADIVAAVNAMEVGDTSDPIAFGRSWLIFRLDGRRPGSVLPIEQVDGAIREALFYKEFSRRLDEHLARLEEVSVIIQHDDRIKAWAES